MKNEQGELSLPKKPPGPLGSALEYGIMGTAIGGALGALIARFSGHSGQAVATKAIESAADTGIFAGLLGYFMGERDVTEHHLKVENIQLKQQVMDMKAESGKPDALMQQLTEAAPACGCKRRI